MHLGHLRLSRSATIRCTHGKGKWGDQFGWEVSSAGDVDADGFGDVIIGAPTATVRKKFDGSAIVFSGATGEVLHAFHGDQLGDGFGDSVGGAGDVDGDGFDDVIVGAHELVGINFGTVNVFSGATGDILYTWHGVGADQYFGRAVDGAGDVNADGFADLVVGAAYALNDNGIPTGSAWVFSGATGEILHTWHGDSQADEFGRHVSDAGDVDGDGFADVIIGAHRDDSGAGLDTGTAYVFSGATGGVLHAWHGDSANEHFGWSVSGAGDVDGDGFADVIVGAWLDNVNGTESGSAFVFSGATGELLHDWHGDSEFDNLGRAVGGAGDADGDGFDDLLVAAPIDNGEGWFGTVILFSGATGDALDTWQARTNVGFGLAVDGAGDVNADGFDDVIVGATYDDPGGTAYVLSLHCACAADVNGDGNLNVLDFVAFQLLWQDGDPSADCDANAEFNVLDFVCFQQLFVKGCP